MKRPPRPGEEIFTLLGAWTRFVNRSAALTVVRAVVVAHRGMWLLARTRKTYALKRFSRFDEGVTWSRSDSVELRAMIAAQALVR